MRRRPPSLPRNRNGFLLMNGTALDDSSGIGLPETTPLFENLHVLAAAFKLLGTALYHQPNQPFLATLREGRLLEEWPLQPDETDTARGLQLMRDALSGTEPPALVKELHNDYKALFVGPEHVVAPPWESVYLSRDHLLFDVQTLQVRDAYARFGLQIPQMDREPDDHIGFELLFVSHLAELAAQALERGQADEAARCLSGARDFLDAHLNKWASLFVERLERHARTDYYRGLGRLVLGSLAALNEMLPDAGAAA